METSLQPPRLIPLVACQPADRLGVRWTQLAAASDRTLQKKNELSRALAGLDSADSGIVAFGSLARKEFARERFGDTIPISGVFSRQVGPRELPKAGNPDWTFHMITAPAVFSEAQSKRQSRL
jgi:hypothetical protein